MTKEDIKKALEICTSSYGTCDACPYDDVRNCSDTLKNDARELIIEQEKEIERLKKENEQSRKLRILGNEVTVEFLDDVVSEHSVDCKDIEKYAKQFRNRIISINEKEIEQAKIDVLNELKGRVRTSYVLDDFILGSVVFSKDIDELIEEIENDNTET